MFHLRKKKPLAVQFCERCGAVADAARRAEVSRQQSVGQALQYGWRIA